MLCVWPEIIHISHWLEDVEFHPVNENFIFKCIMFDILNKVFIHLSSKIKVTYNIIILSRHIVIICKYHNTHTIIYFIW